MDNEARIAELKILLAAKNKQLDEILLQHGRFIYEKWKFNKLDVYNQLIKRSWYASSGHDSLELYPGFLQLHEEIKKMEREKNELELVLLREREKLKKPFRIKPKDNNDILKLFSPPEQLRQLEKIKAASQGCVSPVEIFKLFGLTEEEIRKIIENNTNKEGTDNG